MVGEAAEGNPPTGKWRQKAKGKHWASLFSRSFCCVKQPQKEAGFPLKNSHFGSCHRQPGVYTSPLRKSGENNFHKLERKKPGVQRVLELDRHLMAIWCNLYFQTRKLRLRAGWRLSLGPWISRATHSLYHTVVTKPTVCTFTAAQGRNYLAFRLQRGCFSRSSWVAEERIILSHWPPEARAFAWEEALERLCVCIRGTHTSRPFPLTPLPPENNLICGVKHTLEPWGAPLLGDWGQPLDLSVLQISPHRMDPDVTAKGQLRSSAHKSQSRVVHLFHT